MAAGATTCATPPNYSNPSIPTTPSPSKMDTDHVRLNGKVDTPPTIEGTGIGLFGYNGGTQNGDTIIGKTPIDPKVRVCNGMYIGYMTSLIDTIFSDFVLLTL